MAGLVPAIQVFTVRNERRGCPHKVGPDKGERTPISLSAGAVAAKVAIARLFVGQSLKFRAPWRSMPSISWPRSRTRRSC